MTERVFLDRIEGGRAVLLAGPEGRETIVLPARLLPPGTAEGAALDFSLVPASDDRTGEEVSALLDSLFEDGERNAP